MFRKPKQEAKSLPFDELLERKRALDLEIAGRQDNEVEQLRTKVSTVADALGVTVAELCNIKPEPTDRRPKKKRETVKYRDPDNPDHTWSGRGKHPKWLQEKLEQGAAKEQFQVQ